MNFDIFQSLFSNIWAIFLVIVFFGGSIFIHELGHFLAARRRGLKIERFSIGFGPKIFGWKKDGIDYRVSLFPIGGYVALPQLGDLQAIEGKSKSNKKALPPISYTDKVIVAVMGAVFNFIFAFVLATLLWLIGQPSSKEQQTTFIGHVYPTLDIALDTQIPGPAFTAGIRPGDEVLEIDGIAVDSFKDIKDLLITGSGRSPEGKPLAIFTVKRANTIFDVPVFPELIEINAISGDRIRATGISPAQDLIVSAVMDNSPAQKAGLKKGDTLLAANNTPLYSLETLTQVLNDDPDREVLLAVKRNKQSLDMFLNAKQIPYTKPLGLFTTTTKPNTTASIKFIPTYSGPLPKDPANPQTPSSLIVFEDPSQSAFPLVDAGDVLNAIDDTPIQSLQDLLNVPLAGSHTLNLTKGHLPYSIKIETPIAVNLLPPRTQALVGIQIQSNPLLIHVSPIDQFRDNIFMTFRIIGSLFNKGSDLSVQHLMGPPGIIRVLHTFSTEDLRLLIWFVIILNINLGILNLLPIPVLDGGQILFATIGKLRGKHLSPQFVAATQGSFMILLFGLMLYVSFFDVRRWQGDQQSKKQFEREQSLYIPFSFESFDES